MWEDGGAEITRESIKYMTTYLSSRRDVEDLFVPTSTTTADPSYRANTDFNNSRPVAPNIWSGEEEMIDLFQTSRQPQRSRNDSEVEDRISIIPEAGGLLHISFLHRTVRDYLEREHIWQSMLDNHKDANFNP
jgi:hypothetical protein